jgi:hypothetical protein
MRRERDQQLRAISWKAVAEKRRRDQALTAKEFAVLTGLSYSAARAWFRFGGFPVCSGKVFWSDFLAWRRARWQGRTESVNQRTSINRAQCDAKHWPEQAWRLLQEAG